MAATRPSRISGKQDRTNMPASNLKIETRIGVKRESRRILSIVSNTTELKGFPVGFFAEEMTRAFLMFTEAGHQVDLASPKGGEVMFDTHSDPRTPGGAYADDVGLVRGTYGFAGRSDRKSTRLNSSH